MDNNQNLPQEEVKLENNNQNNTTKKSDTKIYKILSYIGVLWLVGLFVPDVKDDPDVKFHVGQGIILTIAGYGLNIIIGIIQGIIGAIIGLTELYTLSLIISILFGILSWGVSIASLVLMIIGIINANDNKQKQLPVIGKFAFYK